MTVVAEQSSGAAGGPARGKKRGRETTGDMLRSLGVVMVLVLMMWFLAQPPDSDEREIRVVDPSSDLAALQAQAPGVPVPSGLPEQWRATSSTLGEGGLRVGYVTPDGEYAEYAASTTAREEVLPELVGATKTSLAPVTVDGEPWQQYRDGEALSLVRSYGSTVVVVGSLRATAALPELQELAGSLQP